MSSSDELEVSEEVDNDSDWATENEEVVEESTDGDDSDDQDEPTTVSSPSSPQRIPNKVDRCRQPAKKKLSLSVTSGRESASCGQNVESGGKVNDDSGHAHGKDVDADSQSIRQQNIDALLANSLVTCRKPLMPKVLRVQEGELQLKLPFKSPQPGAPRMSNTLKRKLLARKRFVPWGEQAAPLPLPVIIPLPNETDEKTENVEEEDDLDGIEPLILWTPENGESDMAIEVDIRLTKFLRPHQREGVQFMFECVAGIKDYGGQGCILADDMGLGKTLQGITLMWTLLKQGAECLGGNPIAKRVMIVCPTSLVSNWENECVKWLKGSVRVLGLSETSREDVIFGINSFLSPRNPFQVLIISYETFRIHSERFDTPGSCDLLICDEAHRLKNDNTLTNKALAKLDCVRRVLLSGTPMQNHLDEFYAMVNFCNPGVLGSPASFRRNYEQPILAGREPDATEGEVARGEAQSEKLSKIVNDFILRRTNKLLSAHLPPKVIEVVCCRLTPIQQSLYCHFLESNAARKLLSGKATRVLSAITSLKKLCNHPKLIYDAINSVAPDKGEAQGFEGCMELFPEGIFGRGHRGGLPAYWETMSGKMAVLARMMDVLRKETKDRIVVVSNYTQTLDLVGALCRERRYPFLRLDGSTSISKRQKLVQKFNDQNASQFAFLLSSKAGGCGLNLIGGNRLVLFDPDWNPANDKQAAARVWRDGQQKVVYVYRFLSTGTIEEKVFQRQLSKEGLQGLVNKSGKAGASLMSSEALRNLFSLNPDTLSDTYDSMCGAESKVVGDDAVTFKQQVGNPGEEDLQNWGHHSSIDTVPDDLMKRVAGEEVSFVFTCEVSGREVHGTDNGQLSTTNRNQTDVNTPHGGEERKRDNPRCPSKQPRDSEGIVLDSSIRLSGRFPSSDTETGERRPLSHVTCNSPDTKSEKSPDTKRQRLSTRQTTTIVIDDSDDDFVK